MSLAHRGTESEGFRLNYVCNLLIIMYPKEYRSQKDEGLEARGKTGAEKEFGKITADVLDRKRWHHLQFKVVAVVSFSVSQQSQLAVIFPGTQNINYKTRP